MIEVGLQSLIAEQIGDALPGKLWFVSLPEAPTAYPVGTIQLISSVPERTLDGPTGLVVARIQIDLFGRDYLSCKTAAAVAMRILDNFRGVLPDGTLASAISRVNGSDSFEPDARLYRTQTDWMVYYDDPSIAA